MAQPLMTSASRVIAIARIARMRERLERGDPDMTADELSAAIEKAEAKRTELLAATPDGKVTYKLLGRLSKAAALYRQQITDGFAGDPCAALKARVSCASCSLAKFACSLKQMAAWSPVGTCNPQRCCGGYRDMW